MAVERSPLRLRIFVSSPGDVPDERLRALDLLRRLPTLLDAADRLQIEPVLWNDPAAATPFSVGQAPQSAVDYYKGKASECDLVVAIFSGRFGSADELDDGSTIESGSVYEIDTALAAHVPVRIYRNAAPTTVLPGDSRPVQEAKLAQFNRVEAFFEKRFANTPGRRPGAYHSYRDLDDFSRQLEQHLRADVQARLDMAGKPYCVPLFHNESEIEGRAVELAALRALVQSGRHACILRAPGIGKTALASALVADRAQVLRHFAGVLWMDFGQRPELQPQWQKWARAVGVPDDVHASLATEDDWKQQIQAHVGRRRMLVVLDDVWQPALAKELMSRLRDCVFVVTTRRAVEVFGELDRLGPDQKIELEDLKPDDALRLLGRFAPDAVKMLPDRAAELVRRAGGMPQALRLMGKYLHKKSMAHSTATLANAFEALYDPGILLDLKAPAPGDDEATITLDRLVDISYRTLELQTQRDEFVAMSVFRPKPYHFTAEMARLICGVTDPGRTFEALSDLGLVECRDDRYSLHPILHGFARRRLDEQPARKSELQNRLLDWYADRISVSQQKGVANQYELWYRYERADWQEDVENWLYYLAVSGDQEGGMAAFLRIYFDAWWWWGFFQPFDFCKLLIERWSQRNIGDRQRAGLELLEQFQASFPRGMGRRGRRNDWARAQQALGRIRLGVAEGSPAAASRPDDALAARAFIDFALAECAAYGDGDLARAMTLAQASRAALAALGDAWSDLYLIGYQAHYLRLDGRPAEALAAVDIGLARSREQLDDSDPEVVANLWWVRAEAELAQGRIAEAGAAWRRAACSAFAFQAYPEQADPYTVAYFHALAETFCRALLALPDAGASGALKLAYDMRELWRPWWLGHPGGTLPSIERLLADQDLGALEDALFPAMPAPKSSEDLVRLKDEVVAQLPAIAAAAGMAEFAAGLAARQAAEGG